MEQFHFRTDDAELILSIRHEQRRAGLSRKSEIVELLLRAGLEQLRGLREQTALESYERAEHDRDGEQA